MSLTTSTTLRFCGAPRSSSSLQGGEEDTAWGVGLEVGDRKKLVLLGAGWYHQEANAFPAQYLESDMFDGFSKGRYRLKRQLRH